MARTISDFRIGDTKTLNFTFKNSAGVALDISAYTVWISFREEPDGAIKLQKAVTTGGHSDPTNGITKITLTGTDTGTLSAKKYYYGIRYNTGSNKKSIELESDTVQVKTNLAGEVT